MQPNIEINEIKIFNRQKDKKKERKTDRQTADRQQTDRQPGTDRQTRSRIKEGISGFKDNVKEPSFSLYC